MYSGITKMYYGETVGHVFTKPVQIEGTTQIFFPSKLFFIVVHISAARIIAAVKNIDVPMLTRVWQQLEYRIDMCTPTRGAQIEHL
jgi:hypothetical protein